MGFAHFLTMSNQLYMKKDICTILIMEDKKNIYCTVKINTQAHTHNHTAVHIQILLHSNIPWSVTDWTVLVSAPCAQGPPPTPEHRSTCRKGPCAVLSVYCEPGTPVFESGVTVSSYVVPLRSPHMQLFLQDLGDSVRWLWVFPIVPKCPTPESNSLPHIQHVVPSKTKTHAMLHVCY